MGGKKQIGESACSGFSHLSDQRWMEQSTSPGVVVVSASNADDFATKVDQAEGFSSDPLSEETEMGEDPEIEIIEVGGEGVSNLNDEFCRKCEISQKQKSFF